MGIETALIGSAIIGGIGANSASKRQAAAAEDSQALNAQSLALQQRQTSFNEQRYMDSQLEYEKWAAIYGPLQEDVGTYYRNLTGESLSNSEVTRIQEASQQAKEKINRSLAQNGQSNSGLESYLLTQTDYNTELAKADSRSTAEQRAIAAKANFLAVGLSQGNTIKNQQNAIVNQTQTGINNQGQILGNMGNQSMQSANQQSAIWNNYSNNLQGILGYGYKKGAFNTIGTTENFNTTLGGF